MEAELEFLLSRPKASVKETELISLVKDVKKAIAEALAGRHPESVAALAYAAYALNAIAGIVITLLLLVMPIIFILVLGMALGETFGQKPDDRLRISLVDLDEGVVDRDAAWSEAASPPRSDP